MTIEEVLARLEGVTGRSPQHYAKCPSHEDREASLSIKVTPDEKVLLYCHADCSLDDIVRALGITVADLFPTNGNRRPGRGSRSTLPAGAVERLRKLSREWHAAPKPLRLRETGCTRPATHVHLLPHDHLAHPPERAVLACPECDPGGVWFTLDAWFVGVTDVRFGDPKRRYTRRDHYLDVKRHGRSAVELVDALLDAERRDGGRRCSGLTLDVLPVERRAS